jgi:ribosomal-protein-alanine N-acetyltransferase
MDPPDLRIVAEGLLLEPLTAAHADTMFELLSDPLIYRHLDHGPPPSLDHLRAVYAALQTRLSPDGRQAWLNWIVCPDGGAPVGVVQATVIASDTAWIAYELASRYWGRGYASAATAAMLEYLQRDWGIARFLATVEVDNARSIRLLRRLSFRAATPQEAEPHRLSATERLFIR